MTFQCLPVRSDRIAAPGCSERYPAVRMTASFPTLSGAAGAYRFTSSVDTASNRVATSTSSPSTLDNVLTSSRHSHSRRLSSLGPCFHRSPGIGPRIDQARTCQHGLLNHPKPTPDSFLDGPKLHTESPE